MEPLIRNSLFPAHSHQSQRARKKGAVAKLQDFGVLAVLSGASSAEKPVYRSAAEKRI
jgi:hypothetical protein